jgi:hypothetical protein
MAAMQKLRPPDFSQSLLCGQWQPAIFISGKRFLVDTGASFSIVPHRCSLRPSICASGAGIRTAEVKISGTVFSWDFLLADIRFPILGIDFMRHHQLVVDVCSEHLLPNPPWRSLLAASSLPSPARQ